MRITLYFIASVLLSVSALAQRTINDVNAEVRDLKGFHSIKVNSGIHLILTQGDTEAVAVSAASEEDRDRIKTVVQNGVLKIYYDLKVWRLLKGKINKKLKAYVAVKDIREIVAASGASVHIEGEIRSNDLSMDASSGATIQGKVNALTLDIDHSSGAVVTISGNAEKLKVEGSSGSVFRGYDLAVNDCDAGTSSGASVQVTVNKELSAEASSGGVVSYKGEGVLRSKDTSSGGRVAKKG